MSNLYPDESISVDKCWERLHANTLGRLILTDGQHVDVLPVLYAVAHQGDTQEIYIRTTRGNKFSSVVVSRRVAFEIDETLEDGIRSVIVVGIAHWLPPEMTPQIVRTFDLPDSETHEMQWVR
ncbi:pyridoxamine 5'-phosphate oxidase family protein, partial [Rothia mucilaginosa]